MRTVISAAVLASLLGLSAPAVADNGFYVGFDLGQGSVDADKGGLDDTLVDAFAPFAATLSAAVGKGLALPAAWAEAAVAAKTAADATAQLAPKMGRARSHTKRSMGHPDAGAVSLALCAKVVATALAR